MLEIDINDFLFMVVSSQNTQKLFTHSSTSTVWQTANRKFQLTG